MDKFILAALVFLSNLQQIFGSTSHTSVKQSIVVGIDGGTESIRACCFDAYTGNIIGSSHAVPYKTTHPQPGWAEQDPGKSALVLFYHVISSVYYEVPVFDYFI